MTALTPDKILYTAHATSTGGRNGVTQTDDAMVIHRLATPVAMGGTGKGANPEQLFAAGYAACFCSSVEFVAGQAKVQIGAVTVSADIGLGPAGQVFALTAKLAVQIEGVTPEVALDLAQKAHVVCPYSNATRGNIDVDLTVAE
jgi:lipoyl-dependent peroxiredoxin